MSAVQMVPVNKIHVLNPRARNKTKFADIVTNVSKVGLKRPITVCPRAGSGGHYDLVCGQGRLEALITLGETHVPALVVSATSEDRFIMSLVENLARRSRDGRDLVAGLVDLEKRGYDAAKIAQKLGITENYVRALLRLTASGEDVLVVAVERGDLPITVAMKIAAASDDDVKRCLAEAYERGELKGGELARARRVAEQRLERKALPRRGRKPGRKRMSTEDLIKGYKRATHRQAALVRRAKTCAGVLRLVMGALQVLRRDDHFVTLLRAEKLDQVPKPLVEQMNGKAEG